MRQYLDELHDTAKAHGLHVGLGRKRGGWMLFVSKPVSGELVNGIPCRDLHGSLAAAADILRAWIEGTTDNDTETRTAA